MKCPIIKKCGGCFYPQDQYQEELKEKTLFIEKEIKKTKLKIDVKPTVASPLENGRTTTGTISGSLLLRWEHLIPS